MDNSEIINNINVNSHSSIQIKTLFFDPFNITDSSKKASHIFITHTHYDHLSTEDIDKIITPNTVIIATEDSKGKLKKYNNKKIFVSPGEKFGIDSIEVETFPAYNINKRFHKKEYGWVGYKVKVDGVTYIVAGDTDATPELTAQKCDVLFVPVGGTYTMDATEASNLASTICPKIAVPMHYGSVVGSKQDAEIFKSNLNFSIFCKIFDI